MIINLWASGNLQGADKALQQAVRHWPQHPQIWRIWLAYLIYSGKPLEALKLLATESERPPQFTTDFTETIRATAEALAGQRELGSAITTSLAYLRSDPAKALTIARACAALGGESAAFSILDGYYFGRGEWGRVAPAGGDEDRITSPLFEPPMRLLWRRPAFDQLLGRIGLERHWNETGTVPDYRRVA